MAEYSKLGYGNASALDAAIESGKIDGKDIVVTKDTSELIYIRDDKTKQVIRSRVMLFNTSYEAEQALQKDSSAYAGQTVMIRGEDGKYTPWVVQTDPDGDTLIVEPMAVESTGFVWQEF